MKMRELTKNEKILLTMLAFVLIGWGSFHFIITPQYEKLQALGLDKTDYQTTIDENNATILKEAYVDEALDVKAEEKDELASKYFSKLDQAEITYLLNDLLTIDYMEIRDMNTDMPSYEEFDEIQIKTMGISVSYEGDYMAVLDMLNSLDSSSRKIFVDNIQMDRQDEDGLIGDIALKIYTLDNIVDEKEDMIIIDSGAREGGKTPFSPYSGYVEDNYYDSYESSDFFDSSNSYYPNPSYDSNSSSGPDSEDDSQDNPEDSTEWLNPYSPEHSEDYGEENKITVLPGEKTK